MFHDYNFCFIKMYRFRIGFQSKGEANEYDWRWCSSTSPMQWKYYKANKCIKLKHDGLKRAEAPPALLKTPDAIHSLSFKLYKNTGTKLRKLIQEKIKLQRKKTIQTDTDWGWTLNFLAGGEQYSFLKKKIQEETIGAENSTQRMQTSWILKDT